MTREEVIVVLQEISATLKSWSGFTRYPQAIDMAIEALQSDTIEFDFNKHQPRVRNKVYDEHDSVKVVRCKDCRHHGMSDCPMWEGSITEDYMFCSHGERAEQTERGEGR